ncbi:MAG: DUF3048 domain-containing protein [Lachnospiraceae bacterium]|nr:DUF3048 domain-containing protein [Lachnospiraceae bacterium]
MSQKQKRIVMGVFFAAIVTMIAGGGFLLYRQIDQGGDGPNPQADTTLPPASAEPAPTEDPHAGMVRSGMTGQWVKESTENQRPFAVMINNIEYAFQRQRGTSKADILYEALAEGGITRMLAIYQDVRKVKQIGSVRSARHYYAQFAYEWDAIYCHFGHTKYAVSKMKKLKTQNLSGLSGIGPVVYSRVSGIAAPHNVYTTGKKLIKGAKKLGYSTKKRSGRSAEHFTFYDTDTDLGFGKETKKVIIPFSNYSTCQMKYNKKKKKYMKYEYGQKHMDAQNKKQLSFKNVIIQLVDETNIDRNGYQTMTLSGTGKGYYITNGKRTAITWRRNESSNTMTYKDKDGRTLMVNPGKTYIAVYPNSRKKFIRFQ